MTENKNKITKKNTNLNELKEENHLEKHALNSNEALKTKSNNFISTYSNIVQVSANPFDISIMFSSFITEGIEERAFIQMSPKTAKKLQNILQRVLNDWENELKDF